MKHYSEYEWADITPIEQDDGPNALATIAYSNEYKKASGLLRAVMAKEELSERVLALTTDMIQHNPAHYTVWAYRLKNIQAVGAEAVLESEWLIKSEPPVCEDGAWLNETSLEYTKNYQIWHYRQCLAVNNPEFYHGELAMIKMAIDEDSKNYHAWSHYKWLVEGRLDLFPVQEQLQYINELLDEDVRNNSAWSFRFFMYSLDSEYLKDAANFDAERQFVEAKIALAPQNESPWNYLAGIYNKHKGSLAEAEQLCLSYYQPEVKSTHALEQLCAIYQSQNETQKCLPLLDTLESFIPTRRGYWNYLRQQLR